MRGLRCSKIIQGCVLSAAHTAQPVRAFYSSFVIREEPCTPLRQRYLYGFEGGVVLRLCSEVRSYNVFHLRGTATEVAVGKSIS